MGEIVTLAKWDLEKNKWKSSENNKGRSFAIANYDKIINDNGKIDYIISAYGSRVEDHSKDYININEKEAGIKNILSYFEKRNRNYAVQLFLMDADAPIIEDAKALANYINSLAMLESTSSINLIGLSKCGVMSFYLPSFLNEKAKKKVNIFNVAAPYKGTKIASPKIFYPEIAALIYKKLHNDKLAELIIPKVLDKYKSISSNSHMDYDIALPNGIDLIDQNVYDEKLIKYIFNQMNISSIKELNSFKNFVTGIDENILKEAIKTFNLNGIALCIIDKLFYEDKSDGFVLTNDQKEVEQVLDIKSHILESSHHDVMSNTRVLNEVLWSIDDSIEDIHYKTYKR